MEVVLQVSASNMPAKQNKYCLHSENFGTCPREVTTRLRNLVEGAAVTMQKLQVDTYTNFIYNKELSKACASQRRFIPNPDDFKFYQAKSDEKCGKFVTLSHSAISRYRTLFATVLSCPFMQKKIWRNFPQLMYTTYLATTLTSGAIVTKVCKKVSFGTMSKQ